MAQYFEVKIVGVYQAQQIVNRLTFATDIDDAIVATAFNLMIALGADPADVDSITALSWFESFYAAQTTGYSTTEIMIRNLYSVTDFYSQSVANVDYAGDQTTGTAGMPSFMSQKLRTNIVRTDIGRGFLSLTPPLESSVNNEGNLDATAMAFLGNVGSRLSSLSRTIGAVTVNFLPAVLQKEAYIPNPDKPTVKAYRYYDTALEQAEHAAVGVTWSAVPRISTQNSRKFGKGS